LYILGTGFRAVIGQGGSKVGPCPTLEGFHAVERPTQPRSLEWGCFSFVEKMRFSEWSSQQNTTAL